MDHLWTPWRYAYVTGADHSRPKLGVPEALAGWPGEKHCVFCNMIAAVDYAVEHGMPREQAEEAVYLLERGKILLPGAECLSVQQRTPDGGAVPA